MRIIHADARCALPDMAAASIDACVCDPPYALVSIGKRYGADNAAPTVAGVYGRSTAGFMGKKWDTGETAFDPAFWAEVLRVLKPGAHLIAFGGTRTYHRLVCAIEDSGFEVRDQLAWLFGSGFPKSHDVSKGIDRAAGNLGARGKGFNVAGEGGRSNGGDVFRSDHPDYEPYAAATEAARQWQGWGTALKPAHEPICLARKPLIGTVAANVLQHGTGALNIDASRIETEGERRMCGTTASSGQTSIVLGAREETSTTAGRWPANVIHDGSEEVLRGFPESDGGGSISNRSSPKTQGIYGAMSGEGERWAGYEDLGSAARFFYTAKADASDRLESKHPTVKPVDLMAYLIKLVTPPGGVVLDPFAGSGTTGMACMREGFQCILIEREAEYVEDIHRRLAHVSGADTPLFRGGM